MGKLGQCLIDALKEALDWTQDKKPLRVTIADKQGDQVATETKEAKVSEVKYKVSRDEVLMGRDKQSPLSDEQEQNLSVLLKKINEVRNKYGKPMYVSSGYRPAAINAAKGGAKESTHTLCMAVDFKDHDGSIRKWVLENLQLFKDLGLYIEDFRWTPTWVHMQTRKTSKRIFIPYDPSKTPPTAPDIWDGKYDKSMD